MSDATVATLPALPAWARAVRPIEQGREFSAGFGDPLPDGCPQFLVELVQTECLDMQSEPVTVRRDEPRLYIGGDGYSPGEAARLLELVRDALTALDA